MPYDLNKVLDIAFEAHKDQYRKYTGEPYITHPLFVYGMVRHFNCNRLVQYGAILHDVLEDTDVPYSYLVSELDPTLCNLLRELDDSVYEGNRGERHSCILDSWIKGKSYEAKIIRLADTIHNMGTIVLFDRSFAPIYLQEKLDILPYLECDHILFGHCKQSLYKLIKITEHYDSNREK